MSDHSPADRMAVEQHARRSLPYRVAVWYLRAAVIGFPLSLIDLDRLWPLLPALVLPGLICLMPVQYMAYFEWKLSYTDVSFMMWRDVFRPSFR